MKECYLDHTSSIENERINKLGKLFLKLFNAYVESLSKALFDDTVQCDNSNSIDEKYRMFHK